MEFSEGQQLRSGRSNKYTLQERLAATRLSTVWKAEDVSSATVVIKIIQTEQAHRAQMAAIEEAVLRHTGSLTASSFSVRRGSHRGGLAYASSSSNRRTTICSPHHHSRNSSSHRPTSGDPQSSPFVQLIDSFTMQASKRGAKSCSSASCLVMELLGDPLSQVLADRCWLPQKQSSSAPGLHAQHEHCPCAHSSPERQRPGLPLPFLRSFARQALTALDVLHRQAGLVHGDIKPSNFVTSAPHQHHQPNHRSPLLKPSPANLPREATLTTTQLHDTALNQPMHLSWKLIDFGTACRLQDYVPLTYKIGTQVRHEKGNMPLSSHATAPYSTTHSSRVSGSSSRCKPDSSSNRSSSDSQRNFLSIPSCASLAADGAVHYDTPAYMAPETTLSMPRSPASDIWSLACVLFEASSGQKLFDLAPYYVRSPTCPPPAPTPAHSCHKAQCTAQTSVAGLGVGLSRLPSPVLMPPTPLRTPRLHALSGSPQPGPNTQHLQHLNIAVSPNPAQATSLAGMPGAEPGTSVSCVHAASTHQRVPLVMKPTMLQRVSLLAPGGEVWMGGEDPDPDDLHLLLVQALLGPPPEELLAVAPGAQAYYSRQGQLLFGREVAPVVHAPLAHRLSSAGLGGGLFACACRCKGGEDGCAVATAGRVALPCYVGGFGHVGCGVIHQARCDDGCGIGSGSEEDWAGFADFLVPMLCWEPSARPSARKLLSHPWLRDNTLSIEA